ncbi:MAG: MGMT family protein [Oscillospiraceae bacterium]|jgi:methylated-DNA-protein-cysteine methyltransferase-like protein|nr:MGMT family protein [Oscillospiraceae bacterium]
MASVFEQFYTIVRRIPRGSVATYGDVARAAGFPRAARTVGWALHSNPEPGVIPCHRVVNRFGGLCEGFAFGGLGEQAALLETEGVAVTDGKVDLGKYRAALAELL